MFSAAQPGDAVRVTIRLAISRLSPLLAGGGSGAVL